MSLHDDEIQKSAITLTPSELLSVKIMMDALKWHCREDLPGTILYTGAFRVLPDDDGKSVVDLARKFNFTDDERSRMIGAGVVLK